MTISGNTATMELLELKNLLIDAASIALKKNQITSAKGKATMSRRAADRVYGPDVVARWIDEKLIHVRQDGPKCRCRIDVIEIEAVAKASNRVSYYKGKRNETRA